MSTLKPITYAKFMAVVRFKHSIRESNLPTVRPNKLHIAVIMTTGSNCQIVSNRLPTPETLGKYTWAINKQLEN